MMQPDAPEAGALEAPVTRHEAGTKVSNLSNTPKVASSGVTPFVSGLSDYAQGFGWL